MTATIRVNGQSEALRTPTVAELLRSKAIDPDHKGVAVALNGKILPRTTWTHTPLSQDDSVEIVKAFAGG